MEDIHVVAAILTLALHSGEHGRTQKAGVRRTGRTYGRTTAISWWGELVMACVVVELGMALSANDLTTQCRQCLANYKIPLKLDFTS